MMATQWFVMATHWAFSNVLDEPFCRYVHKDFRETWPLNLSLQSDESTHFWMVRTKNNREEQKIENPECTRF